MEMREGSNDQNVDQRDAFNKQEAFNKQKAFNKQEEAAYTRERRDTQM